MGVGGLWCGTIPLSDERELYFRSKYKVDLLLTFPGHMYRITEATVVSTGVVGEDRKE